MIVWSDTVTASGHTPALLAHPSESDVRLEPSASQHTADLRFFQAHPVLRRVVYVAGYEVLSVLFSVFVMSSMLGHGGGQSTLTAILLSTAATIWNYLWNTMFEAYERRVGATGRGLGARVAHAIGYEGGVLVVTIPLVSFMLSMSFLEAAMLEFGLLVFFLIFTAVYAAIFDKIFGLPASALSGA